MKQITSLACTAFLIAALGAWASEEGEPDTAAPAEKGWIDLFDGKSFDGWKASENTECFSVKDGAIVANGKRSHLFYEGPVGDHDFTNFELKVDAMAKAGSNSGVYVHTEYLETGWPTKGYEVQINNTHKDPRKTGSLYAIEDVRETSAKDDVWFTEHIIVKGKRIVIKVDGKTVVDYTEPEDMERPPKQEGRVLSSGTIALQGHDPGSTVYFKNIRIKPLP
jgi:hypothetical protein